MSRLGGKEGADVLFTVERFSKEQLSRGRNRQQEFENDIISLLSKEQRLDKMNIKVRWKQCQTSESTCLLSAQFFKPSATR